MSAPQWFRRLLRLLPFDFRADYGREMEQVFRDQHRAAGGRLARTGVWLQAIADLLAVGPREHLAQLRQDIQYAFRGMRRNPGFVAVAIVTLALGIGTNTAMFSVVHAVLLRPLPYGDPERLVALYNRMDGNPELALSDPEYSRLLGADADAHARRGLDRLHEPHRRRARVGARARRRGDAELLRRPGVQPALGRAFRSEEAVAGANRVLVLTDLLWRRRYGGDPSVVGETIVVSGERYRVVGVMPEGFRMPSEFGSEQQVALLVPPHSMRAAPRSRRGGHYLAAFARCARASPSRPPRPTWRASSPSSSASIPTQHTQANWGILLRSLRTDLVGPSQPIVLTLLAASASCS